VSPVLLTAASIVLVAAAVRSTWSPCGWSMLSTLTPLSERGRGHRFGATAAWFVGGAAVGGAGLGILGALGAFAAGAAGLDVRWRLAVAGVAALSAALLDARLVSPELPHHRRQVNEDWLDEFRRWVYASGFGLQIGAGLATYVMTGGVYLVVVLGALTGRPLAALAIGTAFGTLRGLAVLTGAGNTDPARLASFHRRFAQLDEPVRRAVAAAIAVVGVLLVAAAFGLGTAIAVPTMVVGSGVAVAVALAGQTGVTLTRRSAELINATDADLRSNEPTTA